MDSLKLLLWFVKVVLLISRHLPNKTKLDQDFKACWSLCFELKVLKNESKCSMTWFRCAFGNAFKKDPFQLNLNWTPWKIRIHHYKVISKYEEKLPTWNPIGERWVSLRVGVGDRRQLALRHLLPQPLLVLDRHQPVDHLCQAVAGWRHRVFVLGSWMGFQGFDFFLTI